VDLINWLRVQWDRAGAWLCIALGILALILGWVGVSGNAYLAGQMPYLISGGVGGVFLLGVGGMLWLSADLRDEWHKLDRIERALNSAASSTEHPQDRPASLTEAHTAEMAVVVGDRDPRSSFPVGYGTQPAGEL
jgi:hypothetical protein